MKELNQQWSSLDKMSLREANIFGEIWNEEVREQNRQMKKLKRK